MNVLVTGASGTVGTATITQILQYVPQANIIAFDLPVRKAKNTLRRFKKKITIVWGDLTRKFDLYKVSKNIDYVIHLAAIIPPLADEKPGLARRVNVEGTRNLIESLEQHSPGAKIIYSSSVSVYGDRVENPYIRVGDPLRPSEGDYYAQTKIQAEQIIQNSALDWTIFRLSAIFGVKNHKLSGIMFHMPLDTPIEITTPEDTGRAFAKALLHFDRLQGQIFNLGGGEKCRILYKDFLRRSFELYGLGQPKFPPIAFAMHNFHCGYYADGDRLEQILHFRNDTIDSYFEQIRKNISPVQRLTTRIIAPVIKKSLLAKSEPLKALLKGQSDKIRRFFGESINLRRIRRMI